jgi:polysaccharide chain length determinant protein (PEP-CTERM system associated)
MNHSPTPLTINDFFAILGRRRRIMLLSALSVLLIAVVLAVFLPAIYKSSATILIEEQKIPSDFVMATVTSYAEQRLQTIKQRIMSYPRLLEIINQFALYEDKRERWTTEQMVAKMRKDIQLKPVSAEVLDPRTGRPTKATIAFMVSYQGRNPDTVQRVADTLTSLFLRENLEVRERQAMETSKFIEDEMQRVKERLTQLDADMARFKETHMNELPDLLQVNQQSLHNVESTMERLNEQLRSLKEKKIYLETQIASIPVEHEAHLSDEKRLEELKLQLAYLQSRFTDEYPDVLKTKAEIAEVDKKLRAANRANTRETKPSDHPAYLSLASQLGTIETDMESIRRQIKDFEKLRAEYRRRIAATPKVEEAYNALSVEQTNTQAKYTDLMRKHMEAKMAQGLEEGQKGERFTLIEPARRPQEPDKPNRQAILLVGLVFALFVGGGSAFLREFTDHSVRDATSLAFATSFPVLATIPEIRSRKDILRRRVKAGSLLFTCVLLLAGGLAAVHYLFMDLDILWIKILRRVSQLVS